MKKLFIIVLSAVLAILLSILVLDKSNMNLLVGSPSETVWTDSDILDLDDIYTFDIESTEIRLLLLSDIQIGSWNEHNVFDVIDSLVEETNPDLIITLGDNTTGFYAQMHAKSLANHLEQYDIPWAVTLGNHDNEGIADRNWHGNLYENSENSIFEMGPETIQGVGNFVINIESNSAPVYSLILMDSNEKKEYETGTDYDVIHENQILWYEWLMKELPIAYGSSINSMLFFHIPLPEYNDARDEFIYYNGINPDIFGVINEKISSPPVNSGLFESVLEYTSTTHIFVGHDHLNTLSYPYRGVQLTYGLKTGTNSYNDETLNGGTLVTITEDEVNIEHIFN